MIVARDRPAGVLPSYLRLGESKYNSLYFGVGQYDLILDATDSVFFHLGGTAVYCYVLGYRAEAVEENLYQHYRPHHKVDDLGAIFCSQPQLWGGGSKFEELCEAALGCTGVLPVKDAANFPNNIKVEWARAGLSNDDALYGSRVRVRGVHVPRGDRGQNGYVKMTFAPLVSGLEEIRLRRSVALGEYGAAETLLDWLYENGYVSDTVATKMQTARRECEWRHTKRWERKAEVRP